jgi:hypothetical protein
MVAEKKTNAGVRKLAGKYKGPANLSARHDEYLSEDYVQASEILGRVRQDREKIYSLEDVELTAPTDEIPDAEVIESEGDIIILPSSNRPKAYDKLLKYSNQSSRK